MMVVKVNVMVTDAFGGLEVKLAANHHLPNQPPPFGLQLASRQDQTHNHPDYRFCSRS